MKPLGAFADISEYLFCLPAATPASYISPSGLISHVPPLWMSPAAQNMPTSTRYLPTSS